MKSLLKVKNITYNYLLEMLYHLESKQFGKWSSYDITPGKFAQLIVKLENIIQADHAFLINENAIGTILDLNFSDLTETTYIEILEDAMLISNILGNKMLLQYTGKASDDQNKLLIQNIPGINAENFKAILLELLITTIFNYDDFRLTIATEIIKTPDTVIVNDLNILYVLMIAQDATDLVLTTIKNKLNIALSHMLTKHYLDPFATILMKYDIGDDATISIAAPKVLTTITSTEYSAYYLYNNLISGYSNILFDLGNLEFNYTKPIFRMNQILQFIIFDYNQQLIPHNNSDNFFANFWNNVTKIHNERDTLMNAIDEIIKRYTTPLSDPVMQQNTLTSLVANYKTSLITLQGIPYNRLVMMMFSKELQDKYLNEWYEKLYLSEGDFIKIASTLGLKHGDYKDLLTINEMIKKEYSFENLLEHFISNTNPTNPLATANSAYHQLFLEKQIENQK